ncbi:hypothetical protein GQX74_002788 [Glossina fuscipes]|nr:hypothetical protein GQX74_002788 [Glossina fuscipes]
MELKTRVTASPSTLRREYQRQTGYAASSNPFFNFYYGVGQKVCASRGDLWKTMSDDEKESYRTMAKEEKRLKRLRRNRKGVTKSLRKRRNNSRARLQELLNS